MAQKNISFFLLTQEREIDGTKETLGNQTIEANFALIYNNMTRLPNGHRAKGIPSDTSGSVDDQGNKYKAVVEVISYDRVSHYAFVKLGYQNHPDSAGLRDEENLQTDAINAAPTQRLEIYTCSLIDFSTGIVSYIGVMSAPRIRILKELFDQELGNVISTFNVILSPNIIDDLANTRIVRMDVTVNMAVPSDPVLSRQLNVSRSTFQKLANVQSYKCTYSVSAKRQTSIFNSTEDLKISVSDIKATFGDQLDKLRMKTKKVGEDPRVVDLLSDDVVYKCPQTFEQGVPLDTPQSLEKLKCRYEAEKEKLLEYIQQQR